MSPWIIFSCILTYTLILFIAGRITSRKANNASFYIGNKASPWYIVAYGMIGASISGVTFVSVPGDVYSSSFSYMLVVFGYLFGYVVIANVLMPLYYKLNLTSIYTYLGQRFGFWSYKTGAFFFILSRMIGASFRMFLVINILQIFVFEAWGIPFLLTTAVFIGLILLYTYKGGIKTIIWTDTFQTTFMLLAVIVSIYLISSDVGLSLKEMLSRAYESPYSKLIITDWQDKGFYLKQFLSGIFITIVMTGLDQDMMQKNLSCRNIKEAKKNMYWMSSSLIPVNLLFMTLGLVLYTYAEMKGISIPVYQTAK
jgi:solute:Na+ symporter, SSS family